jgi:FtsZ-binding cell division protein ZapB
MEDAAKEICLTMMDAKLDKLDMKIDELKERQDDREDEISKVKEAVNHPDEGRYARRRELEGWKNTTSKLTWMLVSSMIGVLSYIATKIIG